MSKVSAHKGLLSLTGGLAQAAILTTLLDAYVGGADDEKRATEIDTLARAISGNADDPEIIRVLNHLRSMEEAGIVAFDGDFRPERGSLITIKRMRLELTVVQGSLGFEDGGEDPDGAVEPPRRPGRLMQTDKRVERVGDETWQGDLRNLVHAADDTIISADLNSWLWDDALQEWHHKIIDKRFEGPNCVADAWLHWEESIGWKPDLLTWLKEVVVYGRPLEVDSDTFDAVIEYYQSLKPGDNQHIITLTNAHAQGVHAVGDGVNRVTYKRTEDGKRWPSLPARDEKAKGKRRAKG